MYEKYSKQALPSKRYRELLGTATCVFNSNNQFVIENVLRLDGSTYDWNQLIDKTSGQLKGPVRNTITEESGPEIFDLFSSVIYKRNRIIHSFQITEDGEQILRTKTKEGDQFNITEQYLLDFIKENDELSSKLHDARGY